MFQIRVQKSTETGFGLVHKTAESETGFGGFLTVKPFRFRQIEQALRLSRHLKQFHVHNHGQLSLTPAESGIYYYYYFFFNFVNYNTTVALYHYHYYYYYYYYYYYRQTDRQTDRHTYAQKERQKHIHDVNADVLECSDDKLSYTVCYAGRYHVVLSGVLL